MFIFIITYISGIGNQSTLRNLPNLVLQIIETLYYIKSILHENG